MSRVRVRTTGPYQTRFAGSRLQGSQRTREKSVRTVTTFIRLALPPSDAKKDRVALSREQSSRSGRIADAIIGVKPLLSSATAA